MDLISPNEITTWRLLLSVGDLLAFAGWLGVWVYIRPWPHALGLRWIIFIVAWYRLCEGGLFLYGVAVPIWIHDLDMLLRFACPLAAVSYLYWLTRHYQVHFSMGDDTQTLGDLV